MLSVSPPPFPDKGPPPTGRCLHPRHPWPPQAMRPRSVSSTDPTTGQHPVPPRGDVFTQYGESSQGYRIRAFAPAHPARKGAFFHGLGIPFGRATETTQLVKFAKGFINVIPFGEAFSGSRVPGHFRPSEGSASVGYLGRGAKGRPAPEPSGTLALEGRVEYRPRVTSRQRISPVGITARGG